MTAALLMLSCVVITALVFDFTNGFHDTGNAVASSIATGALKPKHAVTLAAVMNLLGAFLSVAVALTVTNSVVKIQDSETGAPIPELAQNNGEALLLIVLAGLVGAILWNLFTWLLGLPSSSSHALFGGIIGATIAGLDDGVKWVGDGSKIDGVVGKIVMPALLSPVIAAFIAAIGTFVVFRISARTRESGAKRGFRWGQIAAASLVSLAHGTNDAQKSMGVITLALVAYGAHSADAGTIPFWVKLTCALAIAVGTYLGGWRIIRTLSKGIVDINAPQGMAADGATATVILASSHLGFALSTTQVASGSILGSGLGRRAKVRWSIAGRMVLAWMITLPAAGATAAATWAIGHSLGGGFQGAAAIMVVLIIGCFVMWRRAQHSAVSHANVGDEWAGAPDVLSRPAVKEGI